MRSGACDTTYVLFINQEQLQLHARLCQLLRQDSLLILLLRHALDGLLCTLTLLLQQLDFVMLCFDVPEHNVKRFGMASQETTGNWTPSLLG